MYSREGSKSLVEAGLLVAITVALSFFVLFVPVLGVIGYFALPVPIAILYIRHDFKLSFIASIVSALLVVITLGIEIGLSFLVVFPFIGLTLGYCFKKRLKVSRSLILVSLAGIVAYIILVLISLLLFYEANIDNVINLLKTSVKENLDIYISMLGDQYSNTEIDTIRQLFDNISLQSILSLMMIGIIMMSITQSFIYYYITRAIVKRLNIKVVEIEEFDKVYLDNRIGALLIIFVSIGALLNIKNMVIGIYIYNIGLIILIGILTVVGSAVIYYFLKNKFKISKGVAVAIIVVILFTSLSSFIVFIGLSDLIFDFRKLDPNRLFKDRRYKG